MHTYTLIRSSRAKGIRLKISPNGQLAATASPLIPKLLVDQFVRTSEPWIAKHMHRLKHRAQQALVDWQQLSIKYLGKTHQLLIDRSGSNKERVSMLEDVLVVSPVSLNPKDGPRTLEIWLKNQAITYLSKRVREVSEVMGASYKRLRFSEQSTRWGSCSASGTLSFNWRLVHFSYEVIDYVIIHELAHTFEMNHSPNFWRIVRKYCPKYPAHKKMLSGYNSHIE
jgi:predicted metal-dependent hydrolase